MIGLSGVASARRSLFTELRARTATVTARREPSVTEGVKRKPLWPRPAREKEAAARGSAAAGVNEPMLPESLNDANAERFFWNWLVAAKAGDTAVTTSAIATPAATPVFSLFFSPPIILFYVSCRATNT